MNRIHFIRDKFNVIDDEKMFDIYIAVSDIDEVEYAIVNNGNIYIRESGFKILESTDPTKKKIYLQWLCQVFIKLIKTDIKEATRFITEDLSGLYDDLKLFDSIKKTKIFKDGSKYNYSIRHIEDPTNINQYISSNELFDAIFPFIKKDNSGLLAYLRLYCDMSEAKIPFEDKNFIVYTPFSLRANECLSKYASWCTTRRKNGMYKTYQNMKRPDGSKSKLYVLIDKTSYDMFQLHFESNQLRNKSNTQDTRNLINNFLNQSVGLDNFIYEELLNSAMLRGKLCRSKNYIEQALLLGYSKIYFEAFKSDTDIINLDQSVFRGNIYLKKFKKLRTLVLSNCNLNEFPEEIFNVSTLRLLSLHGNKINIIPEEISKLKNLYVLNLTQNKISKLPEEIKFLDPSMGGSLIRLSISHNNLTPNELNRIKKLLPNVDIG